MRCERISLIFHSLAVHVMPFVCVCVRAGAEIYSDIFGRTDKSDRQRRNERARAERTFHECESLSLSLFVIFCEHPFSQQQQLLRMSWIRLSLYVYAVQWMTSKRFSVCFFTHCRCDNCVFVDVCPKWIPIHSDYLFFSAVALFQTIEKSILFVSRFVHFNNLGITN